MDSSSPRARLSKVYQRVLGHPWVYERLRPLVVGGVDMAPAYANLDATDTDVVVDVGCGTGDALNYLTRYREYHGFDTDEGAVAFAKARFGDRPNAHYHARRLERAELAQMRPTCVMLAGLLHHLDDQSAIDLLSMCAACPSVRRIATQDVVLLPGHWFSNFLARLDRGRHVRDVGGFRALAEQAGLQIDAERVVRCHPTTGRALYLLMSLSPRFLSGSAKRPLDPDSARTRH